MNSNDSPIPPLLLSGPLSARASPDSDEQSNQSEGPWSATRSRESCDAASEISATSGSASDPETWNTHLSLKKFTQGLESYLQSRRVFPNQGCSRYQRVYVLMLLWQFGDPKLKVQEEAEELKSILESLYHFEVEVFRIPGERSHVTVSRKINEFVLLNDDSKDDLKIIYYAGHGWLTKTKELLFYG